jgi:hypothetical protein
VLDSSVALLCVIAVWNCGNCAVLQCGIAVYSYSHNCNQYDKQCISDRE